MTAIKHGDRVIKVLEETGLPWDIEQGRGHLKIRMSGHLVGVMTAGSKPADPRAEKNVISQIRRKAAELKGQGREQRQ